MSWIQEEKVDLPPVIACMSINKTAMEAVQGMSAGITLALQP